MFGFFFMTNKNILYHTHSHTHTLLHIPPKVMRAQQQHRLTHPAAQDGGENLFLAGIVHFSVGQEVKVAGEALGDRVAASTRGSHCTGKIDVHDAPECT